MKVAVYWTLKKGFHNHEVMKRTRGEFIKEDYIEFDKIDSVWFPRVRFAEGTNKFLKVEIFEVSQAWISDNLDALEGFYYEGYEWNHYNRIIVKTESGEEVGVYEINNNIDDFSEDYFEKKEGDRLYFNWN